MYVVGVYLEPPKYNLYSLITQPHHFSSSHCAILLSAIIGMYNSLQCVFPQVTQLIVGLALGRQSVSSVYRIALWL